MDYNRKIDRKSADSSLEQEVLKIFLRKIAEPVSNSIIPELDLLRARDITTLWISLQRRFGDRIHSDLPYWANVWPGGEALARYILDNPWIVKNKHVLDVGTGSGVVAMAAKMAGADYVVGADMDPFALTMAREHSRRNGLECAWELLDVFSSSLTDRYDVIFAGDVFYTERLAQRVTPWIKAAADVSLCIISDPGRPALPRDELHLITSYTTIVSHLTESAEEMTVGIYSVNP